MIRTCDVCSEEGEVRIDGNAYVCTACDAEHEAAIAVAAEEVGVGVDTARDLIAAFFDALDLDPEEG